jgi:tetrahydromethanopterin S-methyltransferase subunit A
VVVKKRVEFEDEALVVKKREGEEEEEQEEDVSAAAVDGVVDVERLLQELVDLTRSLLAEVT